MPSRDDSKKRTLSRRSLLLGGGAVAGGVTAAACYKYSTQLFLLSGTPQADHPQPQWNDSHVRSYRRLGRTGFQMSDISFGTSALSDPNVVKRALERGINYFDTSPDYSNAASEQALGDGIKGHPRGQLFIASKFCTAEGHLANDTRVGDVVAAVEASLRRLGTDYLDLVHIHACNSLDRLLAPNIHAAFDQLKQAGKVRFLGVSSHTPDLETVMRRAVDSEHFDVIMVAYNFKNWPDLTYIFRDAHERGVGVVAMKTLKGAHHSRLADFTPSERESFAQAAFRWVLSNDNVSGLVVTMGQLQQIDEYLYASGGTFTDADLALLEKYDRQIAREYCRPGCGDCLDSCPQGLPIDDILRYQMYAENYGNEKRAMEKYARLGEARNASACAACPAPCESACPFELPIRDKMARAHHRLRLA